MAYLELDFHCDGRSSKNGGLSSKDDQQFEKVRMFKAECYRQDLTSATKITLFASVSWQELWVRCSTVFKISLDILKHPIIYSLLSSKKVYRLKSMFGSLVS